MKMEELIGKTFVKVEANDTEVRLYLTTTPSETGYVLWHEQDCCEDVYVESITGDLEDLVGTPILDAQETRNSEVAPPGPANTDRYDSYTWTFYDIRTIKGSVQIRFFGSSNGYYSESASLGKLKEKE